MADPSPPSADLDSCRALARSGRVTAALRHLDEVAAEVTEPELVADVLALVVDCRLAHGDLPGASRAADQLLELAARPGRPGAVATFALGELATARGDHESALARYTAVGERLASDEVDTSGLPWRSSAALALTRLGRHREARVPALVQLSLARASGDPYAVAHALRALAATHAVGPVELLREAQEVLADGSSPRLAAQVDTDLAVLLSLRPTPEGLVEAVALLRRAEELAARGDLFPLQDRVRRQLERLGEQPRQIRSETLATLTLTEERTARLAADGLTNREIAETLRVTVKAVEWHLSHVYRKLGIHSRSALADTLGAPA